MSIRKAGIKDVPQLAKLFDEYRVFYKEESDLEEATNFLNERIIKNESEIFIDVNNDNTLAGFVQLYPLFSSTRMKRLWLLNDLYVKPGYRGKNISVRLINRAKDLVNETQACGLILETAKSNIIGNNLYPRTEFKLDEDHNYYHWSK
jgi:N-acetylglutamate synthase-like GNAT family acetyltransferase